MVENTSIFLKNDYSQVTTVIGWIGAYGTELDTIERLLTMGFRYSNNVNLAKRAKWLNERIRQLRKLKLTLPRSERW